jgi:hypothetical protein
MMKNKEEIPLKLLPNMSDAGNKLIKLFTKLKWKLKEADSAKKVIGFLSLGKLRH